MVGKKNADMAGKKKFHSSSSKPKKPVLSGTVTYGKKKNTKKPFISKQKNSSSSSKDPKSGPRLPSSMRRELDLLNPKTKSLDSDSDSDESDHGFAAGDVYEYEEQAAEEESKKNRRYDTVESYDPVDSYEYELPEDFEVSSISSGDDDGDDDEKDVQSEDDRHTRMLEGITSMPAAAFRGEVRKKVVLSDLRGMGDGDAPISIHDLLDPLHGKPGYNKLRKSLDKLEKKPMMVRTPLPKVERERVERKVAYEHTKKDVTKWEPLVKKNREAPTLYFEEDVDLGFSTVGAIASEFEPRTEFEKKMAALVRDPEVVDAHWKDGSKLLELNKISVEDVKDRQNRLAKLRSLLFRHEMKAKHVKKIKSKAYHRILKKEKLKAASVETHMDPEAIKEDAMKQEFKRAQERMTLKHKNSSKWAKRILKRGLKAQDEGTRAAISEQLHQHELLKRKMNSINDTDSSSSDDSSDDDVDEELSPGTNKEGVSNIIRRAKEKTAKIIEEEDEIPKSGVLSLPFMERSLKKQKESAYAEARLALQDYDSSLGQLEDGNEEECPSLVKTSGRKVFGAAVKKSQHSKSRIEPDDIDRGSDNDDELEAIEHTDVGRESNLLEEAQLGSSLHDESEMGQEAIYKSFDDIIKNPGPKTAYEVAIFASDSPKKMKGGVAVDEATRNSAAAEIPVFHSRNLKESDQNSDASDQNSDTDSEEEMVDGILSSGAKLEYELPSQADLIHRAFAGDDVEAEFEKDKMDVLNEENPEPEKSLLLPGWGEWTHVQQKKGTPSWILEQHAEAKKKRDEALKKRKDAHLKHVIISEKIDKKAEKLHARTLPFPFTSKEVYEQSIRMPIGPEYNPAISVGALNRPAVVKKAGIIIKPIKYEEVDPYDKAEDTKRSAGKPKAKKAKLTGGNANKKSSGQKS